ncbi:hypothetical protein PaeBR_18630 [Paenibacillus sp. BR2-3]|uniref:hypothetical protein n=1 Tax=Paenibacillus sp. BR2-3 TaxID=3048494 RepID=UPI0039775236
MKTEELKAYEGRNKVQSAVADINEPLLVSIEPESMEEITPELQPSCLIEFYI